MLDLPTLQSSLDALRLARALGARMVKYSDGREVEYKSDSEMSSAISDLQRQIANANGGQALTTVRFSTRKGD